MKILFFFLTILFVLGCSKSLEYPEDSYLINVFIPNSFSPNGDHLNDVFQVIPDNTSNLKDFSLEIFDKDEKVFATKDWKIGWDGKYKGTDMRAKQYTYFIKITISNNHVNYYDGPVMLLR